eukprot:2528099-Alexandrium_andersonii.AAC.1
MGMEAEDKQLGDAKMPEAEHELLAAGNGLVGRDAEGGQLGDAKVPRCRARTSGSWQWARRPGC